MARAVVVATIYHADGGGKPRDLVSATWGRDCFGAAAPGGAGVDDELDAALHHLLHFLSRESALAKRLEEDYGYL